MNEIANERYQQFETEDENRYKEEDIARDNLLKQMAEEAMEAAAKETKAKEVYVTKSGQTYHKSENCPILKHRAYTKIKLSEVGERKPCKRCYK